MSDDSEETPPYGRQVPVLVRRDSMWGDTKRASTLAERQARERRMKDEPVTDTYELVEREPPPSVLAAIHRSKRDSDDKALFRDVVNLADELSRVKRALKDTESVRLDVHDLKRDRGMGAWLMRGAMASALAALLFVAERAWTRAQDEARDKFRLEALEKRLDTMERRAEEFYQDWRASRRGKDIAP